jgi:hypothetical protein
MKLPRLPHPATVIAVVALVVALGGSALAARHYVITSTKQVAPKVLKKLKGKRGRTGKAGPAGINGTAGQPGATGDRGPAGPGASWALVKSDGSAILAQSGGITIDGYANPGVYDIRFPDPAEGHGIFVTLGGSGSAGVQVCGDTPDAVSCGTPPVDINDGHHVRVHVYDAAAAPANRQMYITSLP